MSGLRFLCLSLSLSLSLLTPSLVLGCPWLAPSDDLATPGKIVSQAKTEVLEKTKGQTGARWRAILSLIIPGFERGLRKPDGTPRSGKTPKGV
jgi:hypothetical protein